MEKKEIMETLQEAMNLVDEAMDLIDNVADELGIVKPGDTIPVEKLAQMVAREIKVSPFCAEEVIRAALRIVRDLDLTIAVEEDEDDDE